MRWRRSTTRERGRGGSAGVDLRDNLVYVQSFSTDAKYPGGPWILNGWLRVLDQGVDDAAWGQAVVEALRNSLYGVEGIVANREHALAALVHAAGVSSYGKYVTGTRSVSIEKRPQSSSIALWPYRNGGPTGPDRGFHPIQELETSIPETSTEAEVGRATRAALESAT